MSQEVKSQDLKWYVIHTYSAYEAMVKANLEKIIENNNLQDKICEISIPTEETMEEKANGKKKIFERKKFPCYIFLKMHFTNDGIQPTQPIVEGGGLGSLRRKAEGIGAVMTVESAPEFALTITGRRE